MTRTGDVYVVLNDEVHPPKNKLSICVSDRETWFFLINSQNRRMYDCIPIKKSDNPFLRHDSYISCSRVFTYRKEKLTHKIGRLCSKDARAVLKKVESSDVLEQNVIDIISKSFQSFIKKYP